MQTDEVEVIIKNAIQKLIDLDGALLEIDANERTITHRLAIYIEELFPDEWDVDCEYNRLFDDTKKIATSKKIFHSTDMNTTVMDEHAKTVFPDIIVHKRNTPENFVVIEVKKTTNRTPDEIDLGKLQAYKDQLGYAYAIFIRFRTGTKEIGIETFEIK